MFLGDKSLLVIPDEKSVITKIQDELSTFDEVGIIKLENAEQVVEILNLNRQENGLFSYFLEVLKRDIRNIGFIDEEVLNKVLCITGIPGSGKGGLTKKIAKILGIKLKKKINKDPNNIQLGFQHEESSTHILYLGEDAFFSTIGNKRRNEMLESEEDFLKYFSDCKKRTEFMKSYYKTYQGFIEEGIYLKTIEEREQEKGLSKFNISGRVENDNTLLLVDGIESHLTLDRFLEETSEFQLEVNKILITPNYGLASQRTNARDIFVEKGKCPFSASPFRFEESYYLYIKKLLPSIISMKNNPNTSYTIDFTHNTNYTLTKSQIWTIINSINYTVDILSYKNKGRDFDLYLKDIYKIVLEHYESQF